MPHKVSEGTPLISLTTRTTSSAVARAHRVALLTALKVEVFANAVQDFEGFSRELVVEDVVRRKHDRLPEGFRVDAYPVPVFQPQGIMTKNPEGRLDVRLLHVESREELGELGVVGGNRFVFGRCCTSPITW